VSEWGREGGREGGRGEGREGASERAREGGSGKIDFAHELAADYTKHKHLGVLLVARAKLLVALAHKELEHGGRDARALLALPRLAVLVGEQPHLRGTQRERLENVMQIVIAIAIVRVNVRVVIVIVKPTHANPSQGLTASLLIWHVKSSALSVAGVA